jgi:hypothetical protein
MKKIRFLMAFVLAALSLTACSRQPVSGPGASSPSSAAELSGAASEQPSSPQPSDTSPGPLSPPPAETPANTSFYPYSNWQWLENGTMVAVEDHGKVSYLGLDNEVRKAGVIDPEYLSDDIYSYRVKWSPDYMVVLNGTKLVQVDGQWKLCNFSVHSHDGGFIKQYSTLEYDEDFTCFMIDGEKFPLGALPVSSTEQLAWVGSDQIALYNNEYLFLLDLKTDEITLLADFSEIVEPHGKFGVYYGISSVAVSDEGDIMYLAYDMEEKSNTLGTFYCLRKSDGWQNAVKGDTFTNLFAYDGMAILQRFVSDPQTGDTVETGLFCCDGGEVQPLAALPSHAGVCGVLDIPGGKRILLENYGTEFLAYDLAGGKLSEAGRFRPGSDYSQAELVTVYGEAGDLTFIFSGFSPNETYSYRQGDAKPVRLKNFIKRWNDIGYFSSTTHFIEQSDDIDALRVMPIE